MVEALDLDGVVVSFEGALAILTLNDPERLNALSPAMVGGMEDALVEIAKPRRGVRAVMLTGAGRGFCAGANMSARKSDAVAGRKRVVSHVESGFHPLIRRWRDIRVPVVAAINGPCVGLGIALALLSDYVVAAESAFFLVPFRNLASSTDSGLTWLLPRAIGPARARQMVMRAERINAATAMSWGMLNEVIDDGGFAARARAVADEFAAGPTIALGNMRHLLMESGATTFDQHLEMEARAVRATSRTKDNAAAIRAFGSREKVAFTGH